MTVSRTSSVWRGVSVATVLLGSGCYLSAHAATLDAPESVCAGEEFAVDWSGPNGSGDLITIAFPTAAPGVFNDSQPTQAGNPATLTAPFIPGSYEVRYVEGNPLSILERREIEVTSCGVTSAQSASCALPTYDPERYAVVVNGIQSESGMQTPAQQEFTLQQLCSAADMVAPMLGELLDRVQIPLNVPTTTIKNNLANHLQSARSALCPPPQDPGSQYWFTITYAHCRMAMDTVPNSMDIHLPPGGTEGTMSMADHAKGEVTQLTLKRSIDAATEYTGAGWGSGINMSPTSRSGTRAGFETSEYQFEYTGGLGVPGMSAGGSPQALGNLVSVKNEGTAWMASCVPGIDIVRKFYENLSREIQPDQGAASFMAGLINSLVGMLDKGVPMEIEQTVSSRIAGRTMVSGSSHALITGFDVIPLAPEWCSQSLMPPTYAVNDIDQQISAATSGRAGGGGPSSQELAQGMQQLNEAMQQLTPEQRRMMEQFGLGGATGGAASTPAAPAANAATRNAAAVKAGPSSAELTTDSLAQTAQLHLDALGYDPGNTDGDVTTGTMVAISQFQAEKGLKVTGEVSPQLVGILSAEVDRLRGN